jgi:hypothetical protein
MEEAKTRGREKLGNGEDRADIDHDVKVDTDELKVERMEKATMRGQMLRMFLSGLKTERRSNGNRRSMAAQNVTRTFVDNLCQRTIYEYRSFAKNQLLFLPL